MMTHQATYVIMQSHIEVIFGIPKGLLPQVIVTGRMAYVSSLLGDLCGGE